MFQEVMGFLELNAGDICVLPQFNEKFTGYKTAETKVLTGSMLSEQAKHRKNLMHNHVMLQLTDSAFQW